MPTDITKKYKKTIFYKKLNDIIIASAIGLALLTGRYIIKMYAEYSLQDFKGRSVSFNEYLLYKMYILYKYSSKEKYNASLYSEFYLYHYNLLDKLTEVSENLDHNIARIYAQKTQEELNKYCTALFLKYHPDKNPENLKKEAEANFIRTRAICDEEKRKFP
jgi:hypothetical protein